MKANKPIRQESSPLSNLLMGLLFFIYFASFIGCSGVGSSLTEKEINLSKEEIQALKEIDGRSINNSVGD